MRLLWFLLLFIIAALVVDNYVLGCSHNPTAAVEPTPRTSEEGEQAFLNRMHKDGKAIPGLYCWTWQDRDGHVSMQCRSDGVLLPVTGQ